jgi:hypothetical protein
MLPPASRPPESEVSPDGAARLAERITKLRTQAARFRVRYQQFPQVGSFSVVLFDCSVPLKGLCHEMVWALQCDECLKLVFQVVILFYI